MVKVACVCMCEGVKQSVLSVCMSVCQSGEKFLNLNIDRVKRFPKLTVALTLQKSDLCVPHRKQGNSIPSAFPAVSYLTL